MRSAQQVLVFVVRFHKAGTPHFAGKLGITGGLAGCPAVIASVRIPQKTDIKQCLGLAFGVFGVEKILQN